MRMDKIRPPVVPKPLNDFNEARNISVCREYDNTWKSMRRCNNEGGLFRQTVVRLYRFMPFSNLVFLASQSFLLFSYLEYKYFYWF